MGLLLAALLQTEPDAAKLLEDLEKRLINAKTLQLTVRGESVTKAGDKSGRASLAGDLKIKSPNRYVVAVKMTMGRQEVEGHLVSDGTKVQEKAGDVERTLAPLADFSRRLGSLLARFGLVPAQTLRIRNHDLDPQKENEDYLPDAAKLIRIENPKAKTLDEGAVEIAYHAFFRRYGEENETGVDVVLRLGRDGLPQSRTVRSLEEAVTVETTETYSDWKLDEELPDELFRIP